MPSNPFSGLHNNEAGSLRPAILSSCLEPYSAHVFASRVRRSSGFSAPESASLIMVALVVIALWGPKRLRR